MTPKTLDARGKSCPMPIVALAKEARGLAKSSELIVLSDDAAFPADVTSWCSKTGNKLISVEKVDNYFRAVIRKEA
jgi:tRNA 2-thiouridine synthesizing protein A